MSLHQLTYIFIVKMIMINSTNYVAIHLSKLKLSEQVVVLGASAFLYT